MKFFYFPIAFSIIFTFLYLGVFFSCSANTSSTLYFFFHCGDSKIMDFLSLPFWYSSRLLGFPDFKGFWFLFIGTVVFVLGIIIGVFLQWIYVRIIKQGYTGAK